MKRRLLALMVLAMMPRLASADDGTRLPAESGGAAAPRSPAVVSLSASRNSKPLSRDHLPTREPDGAGADTRSNGVVLGVWETSQPTDLEFQQDLRQLVWEADEPPAVARENWGGSLGEGIFQDPYVGVDIPWQLDPWVQGVAYTLPVEVTSDVEAAPVDPALGATIEYAQNIPEEVAIGPVMEQAQPIIDTQVPAGMAEGPRFLRESTARLGWWAVDLDGSPTVVAQYEGVDSSPFWDLDWLSSDGRRTVDLTLSGLDNDSSAVHLNFYRPWVSMELDYQRFLHRLDHQPLTNMGDITSSEEIVGEDLDVGEDYAVRIQDVRYELSARLTERIKTRVNFRVFRKHGERQANTVQHCANPGGGDDRNCHVLSQQQRIDWLTVKVEPVVEADLGRIRAEYSRPMRFFSQDDQLLLANYGDFHIYDFCIEPYAVVPDGFSQADRLKLVFDLGHCTDLYANSFVRDTHNKFRDTHRKSYGLDLRLTNRSWDGVKLTGYAAWNNQTNQFVPFFLPEEEAALAVKTALIPPYGIRQPIDYFRRMAGAEFSWHPFQRHRALTRLAITGGVEQGRIEREYADYVVQIPEEPPGPVFDQDLTDYFSGNVGTSFRWTPTLDSFVRYRFRATKDPLFAVEKYTGYTSTSLPDQEDLIEIGGTWIPADNFVASVTVGQDFRSNQSEIATFDEDNYPVTCSFWYAPSPRWSLTAGYGHYSNHINQDISFPSDDPLIQTGDVRNWNYNGRAHVASVTVGHVWSSSLFLMTGVEYITGRNAFDPLEPWPDLPFYSDVIFDRWRVKTGIEWLAFGKVPTYFRYLFDDYQDVSAGYNSGTTHMFLTGFTATY